MVHEICLKKSLGVKSLIFVFFMTFAPAVFAQQCENAFTSLSVEDFAERINSKKVVVVDVRTEKEYAEGHLKNAVNVVWNDQFETNLEKAKLKKKKTLAVYCRSGRRSKSAAKVLVSKGYTVIELDRGIVAWTQAGKETEK